MTTIAAAHTMPAAALLERPRARNRSTKGAKTAEITTATRIDAVTIHRDAHTYRTTATSPATAMTRQPRAARLTSQSGTSGVRPSPGTVRVRSDASGATEPPGSLVSPAAT